MSAKNLKPWKPGVSANPGGKPAVPDHLRGIKSLSQHEVTKIVSKYARMNRVELQAAAQGSDTPILEVAIAAVFAHSAKHGDYQRLSFLLDRAVGKAPVAELTDEEAEARRELQQMGDRELLQLVREKLPDLEKLSE